MIFIIDDDDIMAECIARAINGTNAPLAPNDTFVPLTFSNAIDAMNAISDGQLPSLIFLDILLDGPDGFTLLHELVSYTDTATVPVVIVSSLDFTPYDLSAYGVVGVLKKDTFNPQDIQRYVRTYVK